MGMDKTYVLKGKQESGWILVDASNQGLGRLATQISRYLLGKHKPTFTPGVEMGDYVVVVNASNLRLTNERMLTKFYYRHSNYPGGLKTVSLRDQMQKHPDRVIRAAVWGMLPHNKLGRRLIKKLKIYAGSEHPHEAQKPVPAA
ncbi:MAG TPA: 50S ribosomal protein L13 [Anaerolinea thermolimosa]|jgi:large subunit ribosomal protein L13|uniref:Large ribosomal subunit protein uL13 n=2 Tax=Anaerolinea thermolimosa TaxID=229919 RepID=A0A3D1JGI6_9CHLR|nr:LSU ribosomal protein L13P [Anaerolinea thermolimosa]HCE17632.1 50S ribosomal protein L13 [Anaerolinea thermolimosa]